MCDAIRIARPEIASNANKFFFTSDAKTPWVALNSQEKCHKSSRENLAMLACDANNPLLFQSRAAKRGSFKRGRFPIWSRPSFFVLFHPFWDFPDFFGIFPICPGTRRGFSRFVLFLFLGLSRAATRNSPERVRDTICTFPKNQRRRNDKY